MCGRFTQKSPPNQLGLKIASLTEPTPASPRYNAAPGQEHSGRLRFRCRKRTGRCGREERGELAEIAVSEVAARGIFQGAVVMPAFFANALSGFDSRDADRSNLLPICYLWEKQLAQKREKSLKRLVGARGFEPPTPSPPDWCANQAALRSVLDVFL